jgi:hypothetical protein
LRVEAIEDLSTLDRAQLQLLDSLLGEGQPDFEGWDELQKDAVLAALADARLDVDCATLVVYRLRHPDGRRSMLVAPRNAAVKPGTVVVCTGGTSVIQQVSFDPETPDVELSAAAGVEPWDVEA